MFASRSGRPFDRRRLAYLCVVLATIQRSRIEISLVLVSWVGCEPSPLLADAYCRPLPAGDRLAPLAVT